MVWSTVAHVVTGAAVLATSVVLTAEVYRNLVSQEQEVIAGQAQNAQALSGRTL